MRLARTEDRDAPVSLRTRDAQLDAYATWGIPDTRPSIHPGANHGLLFQYPEEFAAEVNGFLG